MKKTIFLDRDGVINVDTGYVYKKEDFIFMDHILDDLKTMYDLGYQIIIVTNQSGIARGYYSVKDYKRLTKFYLNKMKEVGIKKVKVLFCPHHPNATISKFKKDCNCRKPKTGLFNYAIKKYKVDIHHSFVIGDKIRDLSISKEYPNIIPFLIHSQDDNYQTIERIIDILPKGDERFDKENM